MGRNIEGVILKALRADDYRLTVTVTATQHLSEHYIRLSFHADGLLRDRPVHPTQWIRLWIPAGGKTLRQRGYTLVDPDPQHDAFDIEFALHDGPAARWAGQAVPVSVIDATVMGSKFTMPDPAPSQYLRFGDTASLPAINSLLDAIGDTAPARVWLERQHESDASLPVRARGRTAVTWRDRMTDGGPMRAAAKTLEEARDAYAWVACDTVATRAIVKTLRDRHGIPKSMMKAQAYWRP